MTLRDGSAVSTNGDGVGHVPVPAGSVSDSSDWADMPVAGEAVSHFLDAADFTGVRVTDRDAWLGLRQEMVTASAVGAILGLDDQTSALELYVRFVKGEVEGGRLPRGRAALEDPRFWGTVLEQPILRAVAGELGWEYLEGGALLRSKAAPILGCTLDAEVRRRDQIWVPLEGKTTRVPAGWNEDAGELPDRVLCQAQAQLFVTGAPANQVFALLQGSRPCFIVVEPLEEFFETIFLAAEAFLERVKQRDPPEPTGSKRERAAIARLHPEDGAAVLLPESAVEVSRDYFRVSAELRRLEREKERLGNMLRLSMGAATIGVLPERVEDRGCWRWRRTGKPDFRALKHAPPIAGLALASPSRELEAGLEESLRLCPPPGDASVVSPPTIRASEGGAYLCRPSSERPEVDQAAPIGASAGGASTESNVVRLRPMKRRRARR